MDLRPATDPLRSLLYVMGGWACLVSAGIVTVVPLLPRELFLVLAVWCFYRGWYRIQAWLHRSQTFGATIDDWHHYHGMRRGLKQRSLVMALSAIAATMLYNALPWYLQYAALGLVAWGFYTIWTVPTLPDDAPRAPRTLME